MDRDQKIAEVRAHAASLIKLAEEYLRGASVAERMPDAVIDAMYRLAVENNRLYGELADELERME